MEKVLSKKQKKTAMQPQAQLIKSLIENKNTYIGIPKGNLNEEKRIPLTPFAVSSLANEGYKIFIEAGAGEGANYSDEEYKNAGAIITKNKKDIFICSIIIKISPFEEKEIDMLGGNQTIISALQLSSQTRNNIVKLISKKTNAIAFENIRDNQNFYPFVQLMSEISGSTSIMIGSELLSNKNGGKGILLGGLAGISPAEIIIIGVDTAAISAIKIANELGATVKVFDNNINKLMQIQNIFGKNTFTSTINDKVLLKALESVDLIINTMHKDYNKDYVITNEMVEVMKEKSVIIDLMVESGSVIETSKLTTFQNPFYTEYGVIHYCVPNIASRVARTSSIAISNILTPILEKTMKCRGIMPVIKEDESVRNGTYLLRGILTNMELGNKFHLEAKDINLLMVAF